MTFEEMAGWIRGYVYKEKVWYFACERLTETVGGWVVGGALMVGSHMHG